MNVDDTTNYFAPCACVRGKGWSTKSYHLLCTEGNSQCDIQHDIVSIQQSAPDKSQLLLFRKYLAGFKSRKKLRKKAAQQQKSEREKRFHKEVKQEVNQQLPGNVAEVAGTGVGVIQAPCTPISLVIGPFGGGGGAHISSNLGNPGDIDPLANGRA